jgi:hypothetical protein
MGTKETIVEIGTSSLGLDACNDTLERLVAAARKLEQRDRENLVKEIDKRLKSAAKRLERNRIAGARLLVVCLPHSMSVIQKWLSVSSGEKWASEIQFSLLCFLSDSQFLGITSSQKRNIFTAIAKFLLSVRTDHARAAWMAGDLLGDHWDGPEALKALLQALRQARYTAGRRAALHGLERRLQRSGAKDRAVIIKALALASERNKNRGVRNLAARLADKLKTDSIGVRQKTALPS